MVQKRKLQRELNQGQSDYTKFNLYDLDSENDELDFL